MFFNFNAIVVSNCRAFCVVGIGEYGNEYGIISRVSSKDSSVVLEDISLFTDPSSDFFVP